MLTAEHLAFIETQRVARLATADASGLPHVVPVCFAYHDGAFWVAIDEKPKRTTQLKRLRNIAGDAAVTLLFDRYADDWTRLAYVMVRGKAEVFAGADHPGALAALRARYPQYGGMTLEERPLIGVRPESAFGWGALG